MRAIRGHALQWFGWPHDDDGVRLTDKLEKTGRALCECGALSPVVNKDDTRKVWHRLHKSFVLERMGDDECIRLYLREIIRWFRGTKKRSPDGGGHVPHR